MFGAPSPALLLDSISATPTAAFATWKLRNAYAGACIRVRRSSDNTEQDIGFSGSALDTATLLTFCGTGDGFITKWYDQTTNARNLIKATTTAQPKIVSSGSLITDINGLPSIQFNGSSQFLTNGTAISTVLSASAYGIVALTRPTSAPVDDAGYGRGSQIFADSGYYVGHAFYSAVFSGGHYDTAIHRSPVSASLPATYVSVQRYDDTNIRSWLNGGTGGTAAAAGNVGAVTGTVVVGQGQGGLGWFTGTIASLLTFNASPSLTDINTVGGDCGIKGGATWTTAT